jgi:hypothetical protein
MQTSMLAISPIVIRTNIQGVNMQKTPAINDGSYERPKERQTAHIAKPDSDSHRITNTFDRMASLIEKISPGIK